MQSTAQSQEPAHSAVEWRGLERVPSEARHGTPARVGLLWFAAQLVPTAFFLGALGSADFIGLGFWQALLAIVVGTSLGALGPAALSVAGPRTGLAQMAQSRSPFGRGIVLVGVLACFTSIAFIALGAIFGAEALEITLGIPFVPAVLLVFALEALVSAVGYQLMHRFEHAMAAVVGIGFLVLTIIVATKAGDIRVVQSQQGSNALGAFGLMATIAFGFAFGWAHNAADYCRYLPERVSGKSLFLWVFFGIVTACVWIEGLGLAASSLLPDAPPMAAVNSLVGGGALGAAVLIALYLGVVANATVAQYSAGLQLLAAGLRVRRPVMTVVTAVIAFLLTIYLNAGDLAERFTNLMLLATYWVGPFVGILAVYWWQRPDRRSWAATATAPLASLPARSNATVALVVGFVVCLPFSNTTLGSELADHGGVLKALFGSVSRGPLHGADLAYLVGLAVGAALYVSLEGVTMLRAARAQRLDPALTTDDPVFNLAGAERLQ